MGQSISVPATVMAMAQLTASSVIVPARGFVSFEGLRPVKFASVGAGLTQRSFRGLIVKAANAVETKPNDSSVELSVFEPGTQASKSITVATTSASSSPPKAVFIASPVDQGTYPVVLFFPGTSLSNNSYSQLFHHISSHGFIVVSPQLYSFMPPSGNKEVDDAAQVANWLPTGLKSNLPENVEPNLNKLVLSGHSRGGTIAFALSLGYATNPETRLDQFSAMVAIDPVAGITKPTEQNPRILSYETFDVSFPVTVIGTGLGGVAASMVPCAPETANHEKFFERCKAPKAHFVAKDYGHMDVLDDPPADFRSRVMSKCMCANGNGPKEAMRRCVGGIAVAFLKDLFSGNLKNGDFMKIVEDPSVAPAALDGVEFVQE